MQVKEGFEIEKNDKKFASTIQELVDYRGDSTVVLEDGTSVEGYIFDFSDDSFYLYPLIGDKISIPVSKIAQIKVTGKDTAEGKSWEAWMEKKKQEKKQKDSDYPY